MFDLNLPIPNYYLPSAFIEPAIEELREMLGLQHWRITHEYGSVEQLDTSLMKIKLTRDRRMATIYTHPNTTTLASKHFKELLLHEMLHIVLDPMIEEHHLQVKYDMSPLRSEEYTQRMIHALERTVEHLSISIAPLLKSTL